MKLFDKKNKPIENENLNIIVVGEHDNTHYTTKIDSGKKYEFTIENHNYNVDRKSLYEENSFFTKFKNKLTGTARTWYVFLFTEVEDPITIDSKYNMFPKGTIDIEGETAEIIVTAKNVLNCVDNDLVLKGMQGLVPKAPHDLGGWLKGRGKYIVFAFVGIILAAVFVIVWSKGMIPNMPPFPFGGGQF